MFASDSSGGTFGHIWQGAHTCKGVQHIIALQLGIRNGEVRFIEQVADFVLGGDDFVQIARKADIRGADEIHLVPRNDEVRAPISARFYVEGILRSTRERLHHNMAAFGTTVISGEIARESENLIDPWTRNIDDARRGDPMLLAVSIGVDHGVHVAICDLEVGDGCMRFHRTALANAIHHVLDHESFREHCLAVVIPTGSAESIRIQTRFGFKSLISCEHFATGHGFVVAEHIVRNHSEADHERSAFVPLVHRQCEWKRSYQVRS